MNRILLTKLGLFVFFLVLNLKPQNLHAQAACAGCSATTINVNLSSVADTAWSIASTRSGSCCGINGSNCIVFNVTLNPASDLLSFNVTNPSPPGAGFYQIDCGPQISIGSPACVSGLTTLCITYCKPGGDAPTYHIVASQTVQASSDITVREGCTGVLSVTGLQASTIQWNSVAPGNSGEYNGYLSCTSGCSTTNITPTAGAPAFVDYVVTGSPNTVCPGSSSDTVRVYITPPMLVSISPNDPVVCSGGSGTVTLTANVNGGAPPYSYLWSPGGQTTPTIDVGDGTYSVTVMDTTSSCPAITETITVSAEPTPEQPLISSNSPLCIGQTINFTAPNVAGATYNWTGPNGFSSTLQNPSIPNATTNMSGIYSLTVTVNGCTSTAGTTVVAVNPTPSSPSAGSNSPICAGQPLNLTASTVSGATYNWTGPNGFTSTLQNPTIISPTTAAAGTYSVTAIVNGCASPAGTTVVIVNPIPATPTASSNSPICAGQTLNLTASNVSGATYNWTGPNGFTSTLQNPSLTNATLSMAGTYSVTVTVNGCISPAGTTVVTVNPIPATPTASSNSPICAGQTLNLTASNVSGATYNWTGPNGFSSNLQNPSINSATTAASGTYSVTATVNGCTSPAGTTVVTVHPIPAAPTAGSNSPICVGATLNLTASNVSGATYNWTGPNGFSSNLQNPSLSNATLDMAGTYSVTVTVNGCISPAGTTVVTVNPIPATPTAGSNSPICAGQTLNLTASNVSGATYNWTGPNGFSSNLQNPSLANATLNMAGTYSLTATVNGCTSSSGTTEVTVNPIPSAPISPGVTICSGNSAALSVADFGDIYEWYDAPSGGILLGTGLTYTTDILTTTTTYYVLTNANGCVSNLTPVTVEVIPNDDPSFSYASNTFCSTGIDPIPIITGLSGGFFSSSPNGLTLDSNSGLITLLSSQFGTYMIYYNTTGPCPMVDSMLVAIIPPPDATFSYNDPYCQFTSNPLPEIPIGSSTGIFSSSPIGLTFENNTTGQVDLSNTAAGTYLITNFVAAAGGCASASHTSTISIEEAAVVNAGVDQTICIGANVELVGLISGSATSATWSGGLGVFTPSNSLLNTTYIPTSSEYSNGSVTLFLTTDNPVGICEAATDSITINFIEDNPSFAYSSGTYCLTGTNPTPTILGGFAGTFSSSPSGLTFVNTSTGQINLSASSVGTYTITFTTSGPCPASSSVSVTITDSPDATFSYDSPVCSNSINIYPNFPLGASAGVFSASPVGLVFVNPSTGEINVSASVPGVYQVINFIAPDAGCASTAHSFLLTIDDAPTVDAGSNITSCFGSSVNLGGSIGGSANSVVWSGGVGSFSPSSNILNPIYTPDPSETSVTLYLTASNPSSPCLSVTDSLIITINPIPDAPVANNVTICENNSAILTATIPNGSGEWFTQPFGGTSIGFGDTFTTPVLNATTSYFVQSNLSGCISDFRTEIVVTVIPIDDPSFSYEFSSYCLSFSNPIPTIFGGATGTFNAAPAGLVFADNNSGEIDFSNTNTGSYTITFTTNGACPDSSTFILTIIDAPNAAFAYDEPFCTNGNNPSPIMANGAIAGLFVADQPGLIFANSSSGEINLFASVPGIYTITNNIAASPSCAGSSHSEVIEIIAGPTVDAGLDVIVCENNLKINLSGNYSNAGGVIWSTSGDGFFASDVNPTTEYIPGTNDVAFGSFTIYLSTTQNGICNAEMDSLTVLITPQPNVDAGPTIFVCENTSQVQLNGSVFGSSSTGIWSSSGNGTFTPSNTDLQGLYNVSSEDLVLGGVMLYLETTNNGNCLPVIDSVQVLFLPSAIINAGNDIEVCFSSGAVQLNGQVTGATGEAQWQTSGNGIFLPNDEDLNAVYVPDSTDLINGSVTVVLVAINSCIPASDSLIITLLPDAIINPIADQFICYNETVELIAQVSNATGGQWFTNGDGTFLPSNSGLNVTYNPGDDDIINGIVSLSFISSGQLCLADTTLVNVYVGEQPFAAFSYSEPCVGKPVQFTDESTIENGNIVFWNWNFGFGSDTIQNPTFIFNSTGIASVTLIVYSQFGCSDTVVAQFEVDDCRINNPAVPSAFTPNGDGNNDMLFVKGGPFLELDFRVFNEWGNQIFMTTDQTTGWDGSYRSKMQPQGTYVWTIRATTLDNQRFELYGDVTLIK